MASETFRLHFTDNQIMLLIHTQVSLNMLRYALLCSQSILQRFNVLPVR